MQRRRAAALYATTLFLGLLIVAAGSSLISRQRVERRLSADSAALEQGTLLAHTAIEWVRMNAEQDSGWRAKMAGTTVQFKPAAAGEVSIALTDSDGDIADADNQPVTVNITTTTGRVTRRFRAQLRPGPAPILNQAINASGSIHLASEPSEVAGPLFATSSISKALLPLTITATKDGRFDVGSSGSVGLGLSPAGTVASPVARPSLDIAALAARATALPNMGGAEFLVKEANITPLTNNAGSVNAEGLYIINAGAGNVRIEDVRLQGTLIIRATGARTIVFGKGLVLESASYGHPTLIIDAADSSVNFAMDAALAESKARADINDDGDTSDSVRTAINGLVISSAQSNAMGSSAWLLRGCFLGRAVTIQSGVGIDDDSRLRNDVPRGFTDGQLHLVEGSFQEVLP